MGKPLSTQAVLERLQMEATSITALLVQEESLVQAIFEQKLMQR